MNIYWCYPSGENYGCYVAAENRNQARLKATSTFDTEYIDTNARLYKKDIISPPNINIDCGDLNLIKKFGLIFSCDVCDSYTFCPYTETQEYFERFNK